MNGIILYAVIFIVSAAIPFLYYHIHKRYPHTLEVSERSLLANNLGFFNALFAFLLGFAVATLWGQFMQAKESVTREATAIGIIYRLSFILSDGQELRTAVSDYNRSIIEDEWTEMDKHKRESEKSGDLYQEIWYRVRALKVVTDKDKIVYDKILDQAEQLGEFRLRRLLMIGGHLYPLMWIIISIGAVFAVIGFFYTGAEKLRVQLIFDFIYVMMMLLTIWLIAELNTPFSGHINVSPEPFTRIQERMPIMESRFNRVEKTVN